MKKISLYFLLFFSALLSFCCHQNTNHQLTEFPSEQKEIRDRVTGISIWQLTNYKGHSHHFYFTNPGWFDEGQQLLFSSDRNNRTNLFSVDLRDHTIKQLTEYRFIAVFIAAVARGGRLSERLAAEPMPGRDPWG